MHGKKAKDVPQGADAPKLARRCVAGEPMPKKRGTSRTLRREWTEQELVRPEAQPLLWKRLTKDQRRVMTDIHAWLTQFVRLPIPKTSRSGARGPFSYYEIADHRRSNVILIDGGRGSGKTSILVTLLDLWRRVASGERLTAKREAEAPARRKRSRWNVIVQQLNGELAGRLIPVQALDLQPLPPSTSLLPWLANRILELVNSLEDPTGKRTPAEPSEPIASWQPEWKRELPSRLAWKELMQCAAIGWNSNLPDRRGTLDPDSYAVELDQAERARLNMVDAWRKLAAAVVADAHRLYPDLVHEDARIVIPIDDADMNPHRCVELLELMRSLWSPHVVFVLTGHSKLFLKTLQIHYFRLLRQPLGPAALSQQELDYIEATPNPRTLARQVYDKVIPSHHRFGIRPLGGSERLKLLSDLLQAPIGKDEDDEHLPPKRLAEYFELSPVLQRGLPHRLRRILNIRQALRQGSRAGELIKELWLDAIDNSELSHEDQRTLRQFIQLDSHKELRVVVRNRFEPEVERLVQMFRNSGIDLQVNVVTGYSFKVLAGGPRKEMTPLPDYLSALLLLASDVAADERAGRFPQMYPAPRGSGYPLFVSQVPLTSKPSLPLTFRWPLPDWVAPVDFSIFDRDCGEYLITLNDIGVSSESWQHSLVGLYLSGVLGVGLARRIPRRTLVDSSRRPRAATVDDWKKWVTWIVRSAYARENQAPRRFSTLRERAFRKWLSEGGILIAAPEYGLPASIANELLETWLAAAQRHGGYYEHVIERARQARYRRVEAAIEEALSPRGRVPSLPPGTEDVLKEIDAANPDFAWAYLISGRQDPSLAVFSQIEDTLYQIPVRHNVLSTVQSPRSVDSYLTLLEVKPFFPVTTKEDLWGLEARLRKHVSVEGAASRAVVELWEFITANDPESTGRELPWVRLEGTGLKVELPPELLEYRAEPLSRRRRTQRDIPMGAGRALRVYELNDWLESLPVSVQSMLQVAHDIDEDEWDIREEPADVVEKIQHALLPHATTLVRAQGLILEIGWPVPRWSTFLDWKLTEEVWSQLLRDLASLGLGDSAERVHEPLGNIIYSFLEGMRGLCFDRATAIPPLGSDVSPETFLETAKELRKLSSWDGQIGVRKNRLVEWVEFMVPLFAAPETGLPRKFAEGLLRGFKAAPALASSDGPIPFTATSSDGQQFIRKLRHERIELALKLAKQPWGHDDVQRVLEEIDASAGEDHPWFEFIGKSGSSK